MREVKTYKAANGCTITSVIFGIEQSASQRRYTVRTHLVSPEGEVIHGRESTGWAAFTLADARRIRTDHVRDCREEQPTTGERQ